MKKIKDLLEEVAALRVQIERIDRMMGVVNITGIDLAVFSHSARYEVRLNPVASELIFAALVELKNALIKELEPLERKIVIFNEILGIKEV